MDTESKKEDKNNKVLPYYFFKLVMKSVIREILSYVIIIAIVLFIKYFIASPINVVGKSMVPTLHDRDLMLLDEISYRFSDIKRFDIVVARTKEGFIIKREKLRLVIIVIIYLVIIVLILWIVEFMVLLVRKRLEVRLI